MAARTKRKPAPNATKRNELAYSIAAHAQVNVSGDNWVGALQDAATAKGAASATYLFGRDVSPEHKPVFVCQCTLADVTAEAKAGSKQDAKRAAAKAWVEKHI